MCASVCLFKIVVCLLFVSAIVCVPVFARFFLLAFCVCHCLCVRKENFYMEPSRRELSFSRRGMCFDLVGETDRKAIAPVFGARNLETFAHARSRL